MKRGKKFNFVKPDDCTFPKCAVEIIDTSLLFSVKTLQYLLLTAIGLTWKTE